MSDTLAKFWLFATHWTKLDTFDNEDELNDELELLQRQSLPTKVRTMKTKRGRKNSSSTSSRLTAIMPATAPAGAPAG